VPPCPGAGLGVSTRSCSPRVPGRGFVGRRRVPTQARRRARRAAFERVWRQTPALTGARCVSKRIDQTHSYTAPTPGLKAGAPPRCVPKCLPQGGGVAMRRLVRGRFFAPAIRPGGSPVTWPVRGRCSRKRFSFDLRLIPYAGGSPIASASRMLPPGWPRCAPPRASAPCRPARARFRGHRADERSRSRSKERPAGPPLPQA